MDYVGTESIKTAYAQQCVDNGDTEHGIEIYKKDATEPVFEGLAFHPESEPVKDLINDGISDISVDLLGLNKEMSAIADTYAALITDVKTRLDAVQEKIDAEEDRIRDINIICNNYTQFNSVKSITPSSVTGNCSYENGTFFAYRAQKTDAELTIMDITGNGTEGNDMVAGAVQSSRDALTDSDPLTKWEYSRYTSSVPVKINGCPVLINNDDEEARCTLLLSSKKAFGSVHLESDYDIIVEDVQSSSDDGITFNSTLASPIHINSKEHRYDVPDYAYGSGIIVFPASKYVKITLASNGTRANESYQFEYKESGVSASSETETVKLPSTVARHAVSLNGIEADGSSYSDATFETAELISAPVNSIAVFASEYVPPQFTDEIYFYYTLTVNGKDYNVVPINAERSGIKVIRFTDYASGDSYVEHIKESIKSAKLKVQIRTSSANATPYLSNLKICFGKAVTA